MTDQPYTQDEKYSRYEAAATIVLVDFDGTLCHFSYPAMGTPIKGARYFMKGLIDRGLKPVIWSCRMSPEHYTPEERLTSMARIAKWCEEHKIPYHSIDDGTHGKRLCLAYVDDRGVHANGNFDAMLRRVDTIRDEVESAHRARRAKKT